MKPHKHAEIIKAYAERAQVSETPWDIIQYRMFKDSVWIDLDREPSIDCRAEFRIKPKTININGIEVPEPYRGDMSLDKVYFTPRISRPGLISEIMWSDGSFDITCLGLGLVYLDSDSAITHAKALLSFTEK